MYANATVDTKYGTLELAFTDGEHVHAHANGPVNVPERCRQLTIRGIPYGVSLHLWRQPDGTWAPQWRNADGYTDYSAGQLYMSRFDRDDYREREPSSAARASAREEIIRAVNAYVADNPGIVNRAARLEWELQVTAAEKAVQDALDAHAAALEHLRALRAAEPWEDRSTPWVITKDGITFQTGYATKEAAIAAVETLIPAAPVGTVLAVTKDNKTGTSYRVQPDRSVTVKEVTA